MNYTRQRIVIYRNLWKNHVYRELLFLRMVTMQNVVDASETQNSIIYRNFSNNNSNNNSQRLPSINLNTNVFNQENKYKDTK